MSKHSHPSAESFLDGLVAHVAAHIEEVELPSGYSLEEFKNNTDCEIFDLTEDVEALKKTVAEQTVLIRRLLRRVGELEWNRS